jgi:hypothetical protein
MDHLSASRRAKVPRAAARAKYTAPTLAKLFPDVTVALYFNVRCL